MLPKVLYQIKERALPLAAAFKRISGAARKDVNVVIQTRNFAFGAHIEMIKFHYIGITAQNAFQHRDPAILFAVVHIQKSSTYHFTG